VVCRRLPSSDNSPKKMVPPKDTFTWPEDKSIPTAMGRSYDGPAFFRSAGARFTGMRRIGNSQPLFRRAARTRSFASWTAVSGRPTMLKAGKPGEMSTSTWTMRPSRPITAQDWAVASKV
jgi:hypothetical protein